MTHDEVIALAREAGVKPLLYDGKWAVENLDVFAALVAAHEREECAKVCEEQENSPALAPLEKYRASFIAAVIRSRT